MRVYLSESLFENEDRLGILRVVLEACSGRHHVLLRPSFARDRDEALPSSRWLLGFDEDMHERLASLLEASAELASRRSSSSPSITVIVGPHSHWELGHLALVDAIGLLRQPLTLYLENKTSDWQFLLALANSALRSELKAAAGGDSPSLRMEGGGLGELKKRIDELIAAAEGGNHLPRLRAWVMFDRDADADDPVQPSKESGAVKEKCSATQLQHPWAFPHVQLGRRSIENYLPLEALRAKCRYGERVAQILALSCLREQHGEAAHAYSMKEGFIKDARSLSGPERNGLQRAWEHPPPGSDRAQLVPVEQLPATWRALPPNIRGELLFGFGPSIADEFGRAETEPRWDDWFRREYDRGPSGQAHPDDVINQILELI
jgi:hypothetical protein